MQQNKMIIFSALGEKSFTKEQLERLKTRCNATFYESLEPLDKETFIKTASGFDIVSVTRRTIKDIDREIIDGLKGLKHLIIYSTGYEWVDLDYLNEKNILLSNLPNYCTQAVAEHTVGLVLMFAARLHLAMDHARGMIPKGVSLRGFELKDKTAGIIGFGRIGKRVSELLTPFGMKLLYYDIKKKESAVARFTPFEDLLKNSDYILLLANKVRNAPPILTEKELSIVKKDCFIINTARADHVDHVAMIKAVKEKRVYGYAVDDILPEVLNDKTIEPGRIVMTAHTAWYTTEALIRGAEDWVNCMTAASCGQPINLITQTSQ
jgi:lactate dehydrogenase-like 2-hydroxyacid dehydrogenase